MATIITLDGGHVILIKKGWWHANYYFDSFPMYALPRPEQHGGWPMPYRFAAVTEEDGHKVTYSLLITPRLWGESIRVEKFDGDSMLQWHDEVGQLIYYRK